MASEQDSNLAAKHMHIWGRASQAASDYMSLKRRCQEQGGRELKEAKTRLVTELAELLEVAKQLDRELPAWKQVFYMKATQNMIEACGITQQEIDDYAGTM